ncbi:hypothetical protein PRIPAC_83580 [Pristionchus pacificus]|uniref:BTB domain-containing protein n=1 Tax=Pristionchus pacificus TaxID=54126 RepID=A0A2A6BM38_PRIPA|nr:hypothetical protein PRIPAC_83580 [Pristionchus pacificus]|eukprot:PDM66866.1 BTB domain-containing protein [Pristionchus pacificus]
MTESPPAKKKCEDADDNLIRFRIENPLEQLDISDPKRHSLRSPSKTINGFNFNLKVRQARDPKDENDDLYYLKIFLICNKYKESNVWFVKGSLEMTLVNQENAEDSITERTDFRIDAAGGYGFPTFEPIDSVLDPEIGFIKDNAIIIEARINITSCSANRFRAKIDVDFFTPSDLSDVVLVVQNKEFHVSKHWLAIQSSYFKGLFFRNFKESKQAKIQLKQTSAVQFETLLRFLYRMGETFDVTNVGFILKLADKYDMKSILDEAETYLIDEHDVDLDSKLALADKYRLATLIEQCISEYTTCGMLESLKKSGDYRGLSEETKDYLFDRYIELSKKKRADDHCVEIEEDSDDE